MMWLDVMMEFDCKVASTWSSCEEREEMAYTPKQWGPKVELWQLNFFLGPKTNMCDRCICKCSTWDNYLVCAVAQNEEEGWCKVKKIRNGQGGDHQTTNKRRSSR